jgi:hypothetical protein
MKDAMHFTLLAFTLVFTLFSCDKTSNEPKQNPVLLENAEQIAHDTKGFYIPTCDIEVTKDAENDQKRLHLVLNNSKFKHYMINIFLQEENWQDLDIESGSFELLFVKHALILRNPISDKRYTFTVKNDAYSALEASLPEGYLSKSGIEAIGIAVYGQPLQQTKN